MDFLASQICHTKSGEINPIKIKEMVKNYVKKFRYAHKKTDSSSAAAAAAAP